MSFYEQLRHFADSYFLVVMLLVFVGLCAWPFRPGSRRHVDRAARSIFEEEREGE